MTTLGALLDEATAVLERSGVAFGHGTTNALDEAAWLLLHTLGLPYDTLQAHLEDPVTPTKARAFHALLRQRIASRKPAAYLLHEAWLGPHKFFVDERVIVPRSFLFELLQNPGLSRNFRTAENPGQSRVSSRGKTGTVPGFGRILDLCTGSGCLAILAALAFPKAKVDAVDLSADALAVAARNVKDYGLARRVRLVQSDLFEALEGRTYDFVLSNPPYVKASSMRALPGEYRAEPEMALASGADGLHHTHAILREAKAHLNPGGLLLVEIGHNRKALEKAYPKLPFRWPKVVAGTGYVFALDREELPAQ